MNLNNFISPFVIGVVTLTVVQPQMVFAQSRQDINIIAKSITVKIDGREYGTGVIVNRQGNTYTVLTNWHVVGNQGKQRVTTFDNQSYEINPSSIKRVGNFDLAIFEFTANKNYDVVEIVDEQLTESASIYIAGYPKPRPPVESRIYQFTEGYISGINPQEKQGYTLVYTNQTRPGMSGAPILNAQGKLVGIHGISEGKELTNSETGTTEIRPDTIGGFKFGIPITNYIIWAKNNNITYKLANPISSQVTDVNTVSRYGVLPTNIPDYSSFMPPEPDYMKLALAIPDQNSEKMFKKLEEFLSMKQFQKADQQTWEIIKKIGVKNDDYSRDQSLGLTDYEKANFPCSELSQIFRLWDFYLAEQESAYSMLEGLMGQEWTNWQKNREFGSVGGKEKIMDTLGSDRLNKCGISTQIKSGTPNTTERTPEIQGIINLMEGIRNIGIDGDVPNSENYKP